MSHHKTYIKTSQPFQNLIFEMFQQLHLQSLYKRQKIVRQQKHVQLALQILEPYNFYQKGHLINSIVPNH